MTLTAYANGNQIAYKSCSVEASMRDSVRHFRLTVSEKDRGLYPGTAITIFGSSGQLLLAGFTNRYCPKIDANTHDIEVSGRSGSQDASDSSAKHPTGQFKNKSPLEISNELGGVVGVSYSSTVDLPRIPQFHINVGERVHQVSRRLAENCGCTLMGEADGSVSYTTAESASRGGFVTEGEYPFLGASGVLDDTNNFSEFDFRSQLAGREEKYGAEGSQNSAKSSGTATRNRPYIAVVDKSQDETQSQIRADWKARQIEARSKSCNIVIQGDNLQGNPIEPNQLVTIMSPSLGIAQDMLIESCTWSTDETQGTRTDCGYVAPEAYRGKGSAAGQKAAETADDGHPSPFAVPEPKPIATPAPSSPDYSSTSYWLGIAGGQI